MYLGAIAYTNHQRQFGLPAYFVGILIDESNESKIRDLRTKEDFQPRGGHIKDPFDLTVLREEIKKGMQFISKPKWVVSSSAGRYGKPLKPEETIGFFNQLTSELILQDLSVLSDNIKELRIRDLYEEYPSLKDSPTLLNFLSETRVKTVFEGFDEKQGFSKITELARLIVWERYLTERRANHWFVEGYFRKVPEEKLTHFKGIFWPRVYLDSYVDGPIGLPEAVFGNGADPSRVLLKIGTSISMYPIARACSGRFDPTDRQYRCTKHHAIYCPYGAILPLDNNGTTQCSQCETGTNKLKLSAMAMKKSSTIEKSLGSYSEDPHFIYITRFGTKLKVGRTRLDRGLDRILEQGCSDALVIYPFLSFELADKLEKELIQVLSKKNKELETLGITKVAERASFEDKIQAIKEKIEGRKYAKPFTYEKLIELIRTDELFGPILEMVNHRSLDCSDNWIFDDTLNFDNLHEIDPYFNYIHGKIKGIIGSFLFVEDKLVDIEKLQGCLYRGKGFEPN